MLLRIIVAANGSQKGVITLPIAVRETERAKSPFANNVKRFEVEPPGDNAKITKPAPIYGLENSNKYKPTIIPKIGSNNICAKIPAITGFGLLNNNPKSDNFNSRPIPTIIIANESGRITELRNELSIISPTNLFDLMLA